MTVVKTLGNDILIKQAKKFGTPLYIYDADLILTRYKELYEFIKWPKLRIYYALKANYNIGILKMLAEKGISIVGTYLNGCSPEEKASYRRDLNALLQMGVTADMLLDEVTRQMPEIAPIIKSKQGYKEKEVRELKRFLKES